MRRSEYFRVLEKTASREGRVENKARVVRWRYGWEVDLNRMAP